MTVYVDPIMSCLPNGKWKWNKVSHMVSDSDNELHEFALLIGLRRSWFQSKSGSINHYDLTEKRRIVAIQKGAIEIDRRTMVMNFIRPARKK